MLDITEFEFMDPDRVDAVMEPANGTPFLLLKSLREDAVKSCGDADCEVCSEAAKAKLKAKQRNALDSDAFAVPGKRKLPIHDAVHVRNALSRFDQTEGLTPEEKKTAMSRIRAAAKRFGVDVDDDKSEKAVPSQQAAEGAGSLDPGQSKGQTAAVHAGRPYGANSMDTSQEEGNPKQGFPDNPDGGASLDRSGGEGGGRTAPDKSIPKSEALSQTQARVAEQSARSSKGTTRDADKPSDSEGAGADSKNRRDMSGDSGRNDDGKEKPEAQSQGKERQADQSSRQKAGRGDQGDYPLGHGQKKAKAKPLEMDNPENDNDADNAKKMLKRIKKLAARKSLSYSAQRDIRQAASLLAGVTPRLDQNFDKEIDDMTKEELIQLLDQREAARKEAKDAKRAKKAKKQEAKKAKKEAAKAEKDKAEKAKAETEAPKAEAADAAKAKAEVDPQIAGMLKSLEDIKAQVERIASQPARPQPMLSGNVDLSRGQDGKAQDPFAAIKSLYDKETDPDRKALLGTKLTELQLRQMEYAGRGAYPQPDARRMTGIATQDPTAKPWIPGATKVA